MKKNKIHICTENILEKAELLPDEGIIKNVCVMRSESLNKRRYMNKAMESVSKKVGKSFWNHESPGMGSLFGNGPRDVRDLIGKLSDGRLEGDAVYANLKVRKKWREDFFDIAQNYNDTCGFSIVARGKFSDEKDADGYDVVEDIEELFSVDLVDDPATTHGLFERAEQENDDSENEEGVQTQSQHSEGGEKVMFDKVMEILDKYLSKKELKGMSEEGAIVKLDDLLSDWKASADSTMEDFQRVKDELEVVNTKLTEVEKDCDTLRVEIEAYRIKEENEAKLKTKMDFIGKAIEEVGLDETSISEDLYNILLKLEEGDVKTMLEKLSAKISSITDSGKERAHESKNDPEGGEKKQEQISTEDFVNRYMKKAVIIEED